MSVLLRTSALDWFGVESMMGVPVTCARVVRSDEWHHQGPHHKRAGREYEAQTLSDEVGERRGRMRGCKECSSNAACGRR